MTGVRTIDPLLAAPEALDWMPTLALYMNPERRIDFNRSVRGLDANGFDPAKCVSADWRQMKALLSEQDSVRAIS